MPILYSSAPEVGTETRIDLDGHPLRSAPNPVVSREGDALAVSNVTTPDLIIWRTPIRPSKGTVLICPGGGYQILSVTNEGTTVADFLNQEGYDAAILEYSVNRPDAQEKALADATKAVKLLREKGAALALNVSSLSLMGFSAGAHLSTRVLHEIGATVPFSSIILIYPAYLDAPEGTAGTMGLTAEVVPPAGIHTRVFTAIGDQDRPEWVRSTAAYAAVSKANRQAAEYHLLPATGHGFGMKPGQNGSAGELPGLLKAFLQE